ncbi:hypothetical protein AVEN_80739-1, partial [Araneus ventricosus]
MSLNDAIASVTDERQSSLNDNENNGKNNDEAFLLKRKRSYVRGNITRFCNKFSINGSQEEIDFTISRLSETFKELKILDDKIHALLSDDEFELDIIECADYEDKTKLTIFKARKALENFKVPNIDPTPDAAISPNEAMNAPYYPFPSSYASDLLSPNAPMTYIQSTVKLPTMKIEPFDGHWPQECKSVTDIDVRVQKLKTAGRCFLCTNKGHNVRICPRKDKAFCIKGKRKHHVSICKNSNPDLTPLTTANQVNIFASNVTHLQTAKVFITGPTGITKLTRCILDGGSQSSFVSTRLVDVLNLKVISTDNLEVRGFESHSSETQPRRRVQLELSSIWNKSSVSLSAFESSNTYAPHQTVPTDITLFARQKKLKLADPYERTDNLPIEVLIGTDFYWTVMTVKPPKKLTESLVLMPSIFGWILSGFRSMTNIKFDKTSAIHNICTDKVTLQKEDEDVRTFWDLETLGIKVSQEKEMSTLNREILKQFHD